MKNFTKLVAVAFIFALQSQAQQVQHQSQLNLTSFSKDQKLVTKELEAKTSNELKKHPEYGVLPYNAPSRDCYELLQYRDETHRYFIKNNTKGTEFFAQSSYGQLNYRDANGFFRTIDSRLGVTGDAGIYKAQNQPSPVTINMHDKYVSIVKDGREFLFNRNVNIYTQNPSGATRSLGEPSWSDYSVGDNGVMVHNFVPGIDLEIKVGQGNAETFYWINKPLDLKGSYLIIRDHLQLPAGYQFDYSYTVKQDNLIEGALLVNNEIGATQFIIGNPSAVDANSAANDRSIGIKYALDNSNNFDLYIPLSWMNDRQRSYPLVIDPFVTATSTYPQGSINSGYNQTCGAGGCPYVLPVTVPAACKITDITFSFDYITGGTCAMNQGGFVLKLNSCYTKSSFGDSLWHCSSPIAGLCITHDLSIYEVVKACLPSPQCPSYTLPFSLKFYRCNGNSGGCTISCVNAASDWSMTVTGKTGEVLSNSLSICQGSTARLIAIDTTSLPPITYRWSPGGMTGDTIYVSPNVTTTYTVTAVSCGLDTMHSFSTVTVLPNDNPGFTISADTACVNTTIAINGLGTFPASRYDWTLPGANDPVVNNTQSFSTSYGQPGTYKITLIDTSGECVFDSTKTITIVKLTATAGPDTSVCSGSKVQLFATGGGSYSWQPTTGLDHPNIANPVATLGLTPVTYTVTVSRYNCTATATVTIGVHAGITVDITGKIKLCQGDSTVLTASGGSTYQWNTQATTASITVKTSGTYSVIGTDINGCTGTATIDVVVNTNPTVTITPSGPTTFCQGGSVELEADGASTYIWSNSSTLNPITVNATGTFSVVGTDNNGCTGTATRDVKVNPNPVCLPTQIVYEFCKGDSASLCACTAASYSWSNRATTQCITVKESGTYTFILTDSNSCTATASFSVTVDDPPTVTVTPNGTQAICAGDSITLTASGASTYIWHPGNETTTSITVKTGDTYSVTGTDGNGCSATSDPVKVKVNPNPTVTIIPQDSSVICEGAGVELCASTGVTFQWAPGGATTSCITAMNPANYVVTITDDNGCLGISPPHKVIVSLPPTVKITSDGPEEFCAGGQVTLTAATAAHYLWNNGATTSSIIVTKSGAYNVVGSNGIGCSTTSNTIDVVVDTLPIVTLTASGPLTFCAGDSVILTAHGASTYLWSPGNEITASINAKTSGSYYVTGTDAHGCTDVSDPVTVKVNNNPTVHIIPQGSTVICEGGSVELCASNGVTFSWSPFAGSTQCINAMNPANYTVEITDSNGCSATSAPLRVTVTLPPTVIVNPQGPITFCAGDSVVLTAATAETYRWSTGATTASIVVKTSGSYYVIGSNGNNCDTKSNTVVVTVQPKGSVTIDAIPTQCLGSSPVTLIGTPPGGVFSGTGVVGNTFDPNVAGLGTFTITYTYTDTIFCLAGSTASTQVTVYAGPTVTISISPTIGCQDHTIYIGYGPQDVTLTANSTFSITGYQWFLNGTAIPGATNQTLIINSNGSYKVRVTAPGGCVSDTGATDAMVVNVVDIRCGHNMDKVTLCHVPDCRYDKQITLCIASAAIPAHLRNHACDCLGPCSTPHPNKREANPDESGIQFNIYPNPFSSVSTIQFELTSETAHVLIEVYTLNGDKLTTLFDKDADAGVDYKVDFDGSHLSSGVYMYKITNGDQVTNGKLVLIK